ncbi:MAG: MotA/TolQ/ExbB proton channel family protein [Cephaloticoccus sp.]|nr:MotA/TolQ/ExbB proton channel family protein [Cephaloticoccus sp.]MCF7760688.1 MotA/TolQ/ExbB proton channel family protein [Cephaloticoccus sp.]
MILATIEVFKGAGLLIYPLGLCSAVAVFIICERAFALRRTAVMPQDLVDAVVNNRPLTGGRHTVLARIVEFAELHKNDEGAVKAFARLEINRMEKGIPYLDVIYAAAPLIGLTGTVTGLLQVFSQISPETGLPDPVAFTSGVALALSATVIGLCIAIPSLVGGGWLQRRVENYAAQLDVLLERILQRGQK